MRKIVFTITLFCVALAVSACVHRIAPFSPHRTNTDFHQQATSNQACIGCHDIARLGGHQPADDCLKCHRIVQGD